ncbi:Sec8 exocyst complex component-specific domain-containing protein [Entophlyctis helioformis]|nr:Sec8 exocyst complex component-specific domain-containing protein [Entophlyctis helioformis]
MFAGRHRNGSASANSAAGAAAGMSMGSGAGAAGGKQGAGSGRMGSAGYGGAPGAEGNTSRPYGHDRHGHSFGHSQSDADDTGLPAMVMDVMSVVRLNWDFMTGSEFNPIPYALSLLDSSSLGRDYQTFLQVHDSLETAMDLIVNEYHQSFNNAIQTFSTVVDTISDSRSKVEQMRDSLEKSKEWLECKRFDLLHLWVKSIQYKEMSRILETIDDLQRTPGRVETLIEGKYYLTAVRILTGAIRTLSGSDYSEIGAMKGVREKLDDIKKGVFDIIVEELHDHLYLKSAMSNARLDLLLMVSREFADMSDANDYQFFSNIKSSYIDSQIKEEIADDLEGNPEIDPFKHIQALIQSLVILERLPAGLKAIKERLSQELFNVVEKTIQEEEQRVLEQQPRRDTDQEVRIPQLDNPFGELLFRLYDKFESVVFGHVFVLKIVENSKQIDPDSFPYTLADVCGTVQSEIKALLYDYLTTAEKTTIGTSTVASMNEILRAKRRGRERIAKQVFRINGASPLDYVQNITESLDADVGLGNDTAETQHGGMTGASENVALGSHVGVVDKYASVVATGHTLLVRPQSSNILVAFKPTLQFNEKLEATVGVRFGQFQNFLDDFVLNVFLPEIQDQIVNYYHNHVNGTDAFQVEQVPDAPYPLLKSVIALGNLFKIMCQTAETIPIHKEEFMQTFEDLMGRYHEKCQSRFRSLMSIEQTETDSGEGAASTIAHTWAKNEEIIAILSQNTLLSKKSSGPDAAKHTENNSQLSQKETVLEMKLKGERSFHRSELIFEPRRMQSLANLHYSLEWLASKISQIRGSRGPSANQLVATRALSDSQESLSEYARISAESLPALVADIKTTAQTELSPEMARHFDRLAEIFKSLSATCIYALHIELRCHAMYYLDLAIREGSYMFEEDNPDPDAYILMLNADLSAVEEIISAALPPRRIKFLFDGLGELMSFVLTSNLRHIRVVNKHGVVRLTRNVLSLQQNLTNLSGVHQKSLDRPRIYYELLALEPEEILKTIPKSRCAFTFDEYKAAMDLIFHDVLIEEGPGIKRYNDVLRSLKEYFVKHRG